MLLDSSDDEALDRVATSSFVPADDFPFLFDGSQISRPLSRGEEHLQRCGAGSRPDPSSSRPQTAPSRACSGTVSPGLAEPSLQQQHQTDARRGFSFCTDSDFSYNLREVNVSPQQISAFTAWHQQSQQLPAGPSQGPQHCDQEQKQRPAQQRLLLPQPPSLPQDLNHASSPPPLHDVLLAPKALWGSPPRSHWAEAQPHNTLPPARYSPTHLHGYGVTSFNAADVVAAAQAVLYSEGYLLAQQAYPAAGRGHNTAMQSLWGQHRSGDGALRHLQETYEQQDTAVGVAHTNKQTSDAAANLHDCGSAPAHGRDGEPGQSAWPTNDYGSMDYGGGSKPWGKSSVQRVQADEFRPCMQSNDQQQRLHEALADSSARAPGSRTGQSSQHSRVGAPSTLGLEPQGAAPPGHQKAASASDGAAPTLLRASDNDDHGHESDGHRQLGRSPLQRVQAQLHKADAQNMELKQQLHALQSSQAHTRNTHITAAEYQALVQERDGLQQRLQQMEALRHTTPSARTQQCLFAPSDSGPPGQGQPAGQGRWQDRGPDPQSPPQVQRSRSTSPVHNGMSSCYAGGPTASWRPTADEAAGQDWADAAQGGRSPLQRAQAQLRRTDTQNNELKRQLQELQASHSAMAAELREAKAAVAEFQREKWELHNKIEKLSAGSEQVHSLAAEVARLRQDKLAMEELVARGQAEAADMWERLHRAEEGAQQRMLVEGRAGIEKDVAQAAVHALRLQASDLESRNSYVAGELQAARKEADQLRRELEHARSLAVATQQPAGRASVPADVFVNARAGPPASTSPPPWSGAYLPHQTATSPPYTTPIPGASTSLMTSEDPLQRRLGYVNNGPVPPGGLVPNGANHRAPSPPHHLQQLQPEASDSRTAPRYVPYMSLLRAAPAAPVAAGPAGISASYSWRPDDSPERVPGTDTSGAAMHRAFASVYSSPDPLAARGGLPHSSSGWARPLQHSSMWHSNDNIGDAVASNGGVRPTTASPVAPQQPQPSALECRTNKVAAMGSHEGAPFGTDHNLQSMLARSKHLEDTLMAVCRERDQLQAEYARMPTHSGRSLKERERKRQVEERLELLNREASTVRLQLKKLHGRKANFC